MDTTTESTGAKPEGKTSVVWRTLLVKGKNRVKLKVKVVCEHLIYVVAEPRFNLEDGKEKFHILKGAVLVRNTELDAGDQKFFMIFNDGIYDALRSQGAHVPDGMDREEAEVRALRGTLDWAIRYGWTLVAATTPPEEYVRRDEAVAGVAIGLEDCRDPDKVDARIAAARGANHKDRRGQTNLSAREGFLWSAERSLGERIRTHRRIRPRVNARYWALVELSDKAWNEKRVFENAVLEAHARTSPRRHMTVSAAKALAVDLLRAAERMRTLSLAPYSRRGFPRIALDLMEAVNALRTDRQQDARAWLDKCRRAFKLMDARRKGEEMYTVASRAKKAGIIPDATAIAALETDLEAFKAMLYENGQPLDHDFRNPVVESKAVPSIEAARAAARAQDGYDAKGVCAGLDGMNTPL